MNIEETLVSHLKDDGNIAALVGEKVFGRRPLNVVLPVISYRRVTTRKMMSHDGPGLSGGLFEISCWGENDTQSRELRRAVTDALDVVSGDGFRSFVENEMDAFIADTDASRAIVDVRVWYDPAAEAVS